MLFSDWQATTHALQPVQVLRSIAIPQAFILFVLVLGIERKVRVLTGIGMRVLAVAVPLPLKLRDRLRPHKLAVADYFRVDHVVHLRDGEEHPVSGLIDLQPGTGPRRVRSAEHVGIEARAGPHATGALPAIPEMNGDGVIGMAGHDPDGSDDFAPVVIKLDSVGIDLPGPACL